MIEQILQADRYLQVDQVEKARTVYQKVVDMDPGNALAVVGLARCALADGDDQRAYELASRALEIDPENDMARRMEARLSEILTTRGQPVERPAEASTPSATEMRTVVTEAPDERTDEPAAGSTATRPEAPPAPTPKARTGAPAAPAATAATPSPTPNPAKAKEPPVRKSLFDRLLGR